MDPIKTATQQSATGSNVIRRMISTIVARAPAMSELQTDSANADELA